MPRQEDDDYIDPRSIAAYISIENALDKEEELRKPFFTPAKPAKPNCLARLFRCCLPPKEKEVTPHNYKFRR